ncbi:polyprenyl synthetase family protein [Dysgonomonas sp. 216]|uniref:polyprenyl synthetase family protein n=1 Tax=Dysgonomonas sp. 216 TaxID=2302934 RepID=UPI00351A1AC6
MYKFQETLDIINRRIEELVFTEKPKSLFDPITYILDLGGKRVRPALSLMAYNLYKSNFEEVLPAAIAIEVYHNFTLLHDDLMDKADMRRGKDTVHIKWDDNTAILSGDAMLIESYKELAKVDKKVLPEVLNLFTQTTLEVCCGQQYDMEFEKRIDVSVDEYIEMIRLKTAVLLACSLKEGAIIAGASDKDAQYLYDFGINIGLAFQLMDDLLDVYGNPETFGKKIGGDILCNKKTFLSINVLLSDKKEELLSWFDKGRENPQEKIQAVRSIYNGLNLKEISEKLIHEYYRKGIECLDKVGVEDSRKVELKALAESLLYRQS